MDVFKGYESRINIMSPLESSFVVLLTHFQRDRIVGASWFEESHLSEQMPVFIISLPSLKGQREQIAKSFPTLGLDCRFFDAVDSVKDSIEMRSSKRMDIKEQKRICEAPLHVLKSLGLFLIGMPCVMSYKETDIEFLYAVQ